MPRRGHGSARPTSEQAILLGNALKGDMEALGKLLSLYRPALQRRSERALHRRPLGASRPSDLVQDTLERALKYFATFRGTKLEQFSSWLRQLQISVIKDSFRKEGTQKRQLAEGAEAVDLGPQPGPSPRSVSELAEKWRKAFILMDTLVPRQRDVLRLVLTHGHTPAEAARQLSASEQEIYTALRHGSAQLHRRLFSDSNTLTDSSHSPAEALLDQGLAAYLRRRPLPSQSALESLLREYSACAMPLRQLIAEIQQLEQLLSDSSSAP